ncbi:MAG: hypothetical protein GF309_05960 [Candidatus Lokiarchaeota archaeon]|nr:hypothetical protein [Candidatus Lokiarchaeota archaeon]
MLDYGTDYTQRGKVYGFLISFLVSWALRSSPVILTYLLDYSLLILYVFPFWLGFDLLLISVFAVYGWFGVGLAVLFDAYLRPTLTMEPLLFALSELIIISLLIISHSRLWYNRISSKVGSLIAAVAIPFSSALVLFCGLVYVLDMSVSPSDWSSLALIWIGSFLSLCVLSPLSLRVFELRHSTVRPWCSAWLMMLLTGDSGRRSRRMGDANGRHSQSQRDARNEEPNVVVLCDRCHGENNLSRDTCRHCGVNL